MTKLVDFFWRIIPADPILKTADHALPENRARINAGW